MMKIISGSGYSGMFHSDAFVGITTKKNIMKRAFIFLWLITLAFMTVNSQKKIEPNWESIDGRPVAPWFHDAKFGIFIHWGLYSVPAWSPKGTYTEWYQFWLQDKTLFGNGKFTGTEVYDYHVKKYGKDFTYYQFAPMFKAELFDPDEWADLFVNAGAKYIVLTSKHHDGYCLWPNEQANDRGFRWNSMDIGPHRDLIGELEKAVRKTDIKFGLYYSLFEWYHPLWKFDREKYVSDHMFPQFKDLVTKYKPDIIWPDGEWDMTADKWRSPELLAWLFNESPVGNTVVINDRWGKGFRKKHGGYYTTEYEATAEFNKPWEECRGMGFSFGYNRAEDLQDYNSAQTLILMLVDIVSHGGNLLLDIGPDGHGKIPVIMQERLLQMGKWLKVNGEAIYGTRKWKEPVQWSKGDRNYKPEQHYLGGDMVLKQTIDPEPGYAVKEYFFTTKDGVLYIISPKWRDKKIVINNVNASSGAKVTLLGQEGTFKWKNQGKNLVIEVPSKDKFSFSTEEQYAYVFKVSTIKQ
jgi:alpha-L-fucosidase